MSSRDLSAGRFRPRRHGAQTHHPFEYDLCDSASCVRIVPSDVSDYGGEVLGGAFGAENPHRPRRRLSMRATTSSCSSTLPAAMSSSPRFTASSKPLLAVEEPIELSLDEFLRRERVLRSELLQSLFLRGRELDCHDQTQGGLRGCVNCAFMISRNCAKEIDSRSDPQSPGLVNWLCEAGGTRGG